MLQRYISTKIDGIGDILIKPPRAIDGENVRCYLTGTDEEWRRSRVERSRPDPLPAGLQEKTQSFSSFRTPTPGDSTQARVPYSLLYLERALRNAGVDVVLLDQQQQPDYSTILAALSDRLLLAGVSSLTGEQIYGGIAFSKKVRENCDASIVWGGWHPTLLPEQTLQEPYIDYVVVGQGERPLRELVERLREGKKYFGYTGHRLQTQRRRHREPACAAGRYQYFSTH